MDFADNSFSGIFPARQLHIKQEIIIYLREILLAFFLSFSSIIHESPAIWVLEIPPSSLQSIQLARVYGVLRKQIDIALALHIETVPDRKLTGGRSKWGRIRDRHTQMAQIELAHVYPHRPYLCY